jgi:hypothetical protein
VIEDDPRRRNIGRERDGVKVGQFEKQPDIGLVASSQWIADEDDRVDPVLDDARGDLHVVSTRLRRDPLDLHAERTLNGSGGVIRCQQANVHDRPANLREQVDELVLLGAVRNQCDDRPLSRPIHRQLVNRTHAGESNSPTSTAKGVLVTGP